MTLNYSEKNVIIYNIKILEGSMGGHMSHIIGNEDFTGEDIK